MDSVSMKPFIPDDVKSCAPAWQNYKREFLVHLDSAGLDDKPWRRKVGQLLKCMGLEAIKIYDTFEWAPALEAVAANPNTFVEAVEARAAENKYDLDTVFRKFDMHFGVRNYRVMKRQAFLDLKRSKQQTVMDFVTVLKREAEYCEFGEMKDSLICDKIINTIQDSRCSERLLELDDAEVTLPLVIQICRQAEITRAHMKTIEDNDKHQTSVYRERKRGHDHSRERGKQRERLRNESYSQNDRRVPRYCDRCCRNHDRNQCSAYNKRCNACGEIGHFSKSPRCTQHRRSGRPRFSGQNTGFDHSRRGFNRGNSRGLQKSRTHLNDVHYVNDDYYECIDEVTEMFDNVNFDNAYIATVESSDVAAARTNDMSSEWVVNLNVRGKCLPLEIDTGAGCNILSKTTLNKLNVPHVVEQSSTVVKGVHGESRKAESVVTLPCAYKRVKKDVVFQVFNGPKKLDLLGRDDSVYFGLITRVNNVTPVKTCKQIVSDFSDVVCDSVGCMPGMYKIKIDESVQPVVHASRPVPAPLRGKVKRELEHLEGNNIITRVTEPTSWVSSMVVARKKNSDRVRICIDPTDLNTAIKREHYPMNNFDDIVTKTHR